MTAKKVAMVNAAAVFFGVVLSITSMTFVNYAVELGFLSGVQDRKLFVIPLSGGVGVGVVNLIPISGLLMVIGSAVYATSGIRWGTGTDQSED